MCIYCPFGLEKEMEIRLGQIIIQTIGGQPCYIITINTIIKQ
jgi:hypothetical protein